MFTDKVYFENINHKKVFCDLAEPESNQKKIVIMSHGFRGSSTGPARTFVDFSQILNKNGFSTLRFDQPNSGNSEGDYLETSYAEWVKTIVYLADKYLKLDYQVALLGQSMGASASMVAASKPELKNKISCLLLWVPGVNEVDFKGQPKEIFEEGGQKYQGKFWLEANTAHFLKCLKSYQGGIHLVYGEMDKYIRQELRDQVIDMVKTKGQPTKVLKGQDHSPWEFALCQEVYSEELNFLKKYFK